MIGPPASLTKERPFISLVTDFNHRWAVVEDVGSDSQTGGRLLCQRMSAGLFQSSQEEQLDDSSQALHYVQSKLASSLLAAQAMMKEGK